jgi:hypothetical protein
MQHRSAHGRQQLQNLRPARNRLGLALGRSREESGKRTEPFDQISGQSCGAFGDERAQQRRQVVSAERLFTRWR